MGFVASLYQTLARLTPSPDPESTGGAPADPGVPTRTLGAEGVLPLVHLRVLREFLQRHGAILDRYGEGRRWTRGQFLTTADAPPPGLFLVTQGEVRAQWWFGGAHASGVVAGPGSLFGNLTVPTVGAAAEGPVLEVRVLARATTAVEACFLPVDHFDEVDAATGGDLRRCLEYIGELSVTGSVLLDELRRVDALSSVSAARLSAFLDEAERVVFRRGDRLISPETPPDAILGVLQGGTSIWVGDLRADHRGPGQVFGQHAVYTDTRSTGISVVAESDEVVAARIPFAWFRAQEARHEAARRDFATALVSIRERQLVLTDDPALPAPQLAWLCANAIAQHQPDGAALVRLHRPGAPLRPLPASVALRVVDLELPASGSLRPAIDAALGEGPHRWIVVDPFSGGIPVDERVAAAVDRVVHFAGDPLCGPTERCVWSRPRTVIHLLDRPHTVHGAMPIRTARLRLQPAELAAPETLAEARESRLSRVLCRRQVGVALGGGGSWGYAHVAFLRALDDLKVPVDLVSGSSFGALTGAFYCTRGIEGLAELCARGGEMDQVITRSMISSQAISTWIDQTLRQPDGTPYRIEELEVGYVPVCTDLNNDMTWPVVEGTVGYGARLSSAMPPTITPVIEGNSRYIDGGFRANVPVDILVASGMGLRFSSNIVPPGRGVEAPPTFPGRVGAALHAFNPFRRVEDILRGELLAFHTMGTLESHMADVAFEPVPRPVKFWEFSGGEAIAARDYPQARERARACKQLYVNLCSGGLARAEAISRVTPGDPHPPRRVSSVVAPVRGA